MDNYETESNCSYNSDSPQSNASSVSGLSLYGNEFAELRHLVNPSKYPEPYLERSSTPKPELAINIIGDDKLEQLKHELQRSLELNERYKLELRNLERKTELKFCDKIDKLLRSNSRLEGELENAHNQIDRLIHNYRDKQDYLIFKEKLDLEKKVYELNLSYSKLQSHCAKIQQDKYEADLVNKNVKVSLGELATEREIKNASIQSLKQKISDQHIEIQNSLKENSKLMEKLNFLSSNIIEAEKSKLWYKEQLTVCQNDKIKLKEELIKSKNHIAESNEKMSYLNIDLIKYKNEVDEVRMQALKQKEELFKKLENINLDSNILRNVPELVNNDTNNKLSFYDIDFYEQTIQDLREEVSNIKTAILVKDKEFEKLNHENSEAISKCLVLQQTLKQKEAENELSGKLENLKESVKDKLAEILQLKNRVTELEIELKTRNQEKHDVEESIRLVRDQFLKFKQNYEKVRNELYLKNKEILQLQKDKQELFMNNNWTICELDKLKHKDIVIEDLKKENDILVATIKTLKQDVRKVEFQLLKSDKVIKENENSIKELANQNQTIENDNVEKICHLESELKQMSVKYTELETAYDYAESEIKDKCIKLNESYKTIAQQQAEYKKNIEEISAEKNISILKSQKILQETHNNEINSKDQVISDLKKRLNKLEEEWQNYIKRITDDQKVELLLNNQTSFGLLTTNNIRKENGFSTKHIENFVENFFGNLNVEEFESSVDIRLKYLEERLSKVREKSVQLEAILNNQSAGNKIKELEILLQVKERDMQEKRRKMDKNNRTLLRKVKEHMRGRNAAEKQLKYLQDLYNTLADDHNTSALAICSKEHEIKSLQEFCVGYKREIEKLRNTVVNLEQELSKAKMCDSCLEMEHLKQKLIYFEELCNDVSCRNKRLGEELECSRENINSLTKQIEEQEIKEASQQKQIADILAQNEGFKVSLSKIQDMEKENALQKELIKNLEDKLVETGHLYQQSLEFIERINKDFIEATEKVQFLSQEIEQKADSSKELEATILKLQEQLTQENAKRENAISVYQQRIHSLQSCIKVLKNDKFFLQRLSNDLKVALKSYVDHNKKLQEQLNVLNVEAQPFKSLPTSFPNDLSFSGKYDENHISRLLKENRAPSAGKPVTAEIRGCLDKLRQEIFSLQNQISKKNGLGSLDSG